MQKKTQNERFARGRNVPDPVIHDYLSVLLRGKWIIIATAAAFFLAAGIHAKLSRPTYKATASVIIDSKLSISSLLMSALSTTPVKSTLQNELEVLKSRSLAESVAVRLLSTVYLDPEKGEIINVVRVPEKERNRRSLATVQEIVKRFGGSVDFTPVRESDIVKITAQSVDAREAALLANTFARTYYSRNVQKSREKSRSVREFLDTQVTEKRTSLEDQEARMQRYMETKGIVSLEGDAKKVVDQLAHLEATRDATEINLQSLVRTLASYERQVPLQEQNLAKAIGGANDPYIRILQEQLATLEVQRDVAVTQNPSAVQKEVYSDKLKEIDAQIRSLRQKLQSRTSDFIESLVPSSSGPDQTSASGFLRQVKQKMLETQIEVQALQAKKKALDDMIRLYDKEFERIPEKSIQFARMQRARLSTEKLFLALNEKYNEATIAEESQFGYIDIIDEAPVPLDPASPRLLLNLGVGLGLGLLFGVGFVLLREYRDARIHTPEDLKVKGIIISGVVRQMDQELHRLGLEPVVPINGSFVDSHLLVHISPTSPLAEAYRMLRSQVQYEKSGRRPQTILLASPNTGEGKTVTLSNLAVAFAQAGKTVLAMDTNFRGPKLHSLFDVKPTPGLSELLRDNATSENVVQLSVVRNLHILSAGDVPATPAELIESEKMQEIIEQARMRYDVVLFDSPSILEVADAGILSTMVDGVILVVSAGMTRMEEVARSVDLIDRLGGPIPKYVLNNFDPRKAYGIPSKRSGF